MYTTHIKIINHAHTSNHWDRVIYHNNIPARGHPMIELRLSTIDFIESNVDLFVLSKVLLVIVSSIGKIKSSIKLYITNKLTIKITGSETLENKRREANPKHTQKIIFVGFFLNFNTFSAINGTIIHHVPIIAYTSHIFSILNHKFWI